MNSTTSLQGDWVGCSDLCEWNFSFEAKRETRTRREWSLESCENPKLEKPVVGYANRSYLLFSVIKSCQALDPMDFCIQGLPVLHYLIDLLRLIAYIGQMSHLTLCLPVLLLPSIFPGIKVFSNVIRLFASSGQSVGASAGEWCILDRGVVASAVVSSLQELEV